MVEEHSTVLTSRHTSGGGSFDASEFTSTINPLASITSTMTPAATDTSNTTNTNSGGGNSAVPITMPSGGGTNRPLPPPPIGATPINPATISINTNMSSNSSNTNSSIADRESSSNSRDTISNVTSNEPLTTPEKLDSKDLSGSDGDHAGGDQDRNSKHSSPEANSPSGRSNTGESPKPGTSSGGGRADSASPRSPEENKANNDQTGKDVSQQQQPCTSGAFVVNPAAAARRLKQENERLQAELTRLRRLVITNAAAASKGEDGSPSGAQASDLELQVAREAIVALRADRKRLKAEKFELLNQMKQLYATLEDKEKELRDFIRNYEQRVRESDASLQQLSTEREERERERWSLLRHARDEAERSLSLAAQLNAKELQLRQAHEQLRDARRQLHGCLSDGEESRGRGGLVTTPGSLAPGDRGSCSADSGVVRDRAETASSIGGNLSDSTTDGAPTITVEGSNMDMDNISVVSSIAPPHLYQLSTPKDCSPTLSPLNANAFSRSIDAGILSRSVEQLSSPLGDGEPMPSAIGRRKPSSTRPGGRGGTWGSISRVFARSRHRNKAASAAVAAVAADGGEDAAYRSWSPLTEEGYAEKLRLLREAASVPMERWRAPTVLAWLEIALGMPQYGPRCAENVKSGKLRALNGQVLLELSDLELECGLGITHPMHRKKLRLAIEEHRHPSLVRYPCIAQLGHTWVSSEWLPDLGLAQYSDSFAANMVDARMLEHLSKKELEKYLGVTRKFHQASVVHGIHLLRIMRYDRQALAVRRHQCETVDADPLVWSNQRFIRWARSIDLAEYADNLRDSGVHGGLVVLEPSFNGDTMATALGIPPGKNIVRRHLAAELEALILPARSTMGHVVRGKTRALSGGSLGRPPAPHTNSMASIVSSASSTGHQEHSRTAGLRGSLSRALGLARSRSDKHSPTSSSESSSVVSASRVSVSPLQQSGGESPVYATPYNFRYSYSGSGRDRMSDRDSCECRSTMTPTKDYLDNFMMDGSSSLRRHRRVRSIGDIDVIPIAPV